MKSFQNNKPQLSIKKQATWGTILIIGSYGLSQAVRLGGNLILTRILVPEIFGLMALVRVFISALALFSDIGVGASIIRSDRGKDVIFLNTAWSLQVLRGVILWILAIIFSYPIAIFYHQPSLATILPVVGANLFIAGFNSTTLFTLQKDIRYGKLSIMELTSQILGLIVMIGLAYFYRNVWALVCGVLLSSIVKTVWSHFLDRSKKNRFAFERSAAAELFSFGKWIFLATALVFLGNQTDRILLGKIFPLVFLGTYSVALVFSELPRLLVAQVSGKVIFPLISLYAHLPRHELRKKILTKRKLLLLPIAILVALLTCFGDFLIIFLYDARYHQAAWMLPILALGMWPLILYVTIDGCLYVVDKVKYPALGNFLKVGLMCITIPYFFSKAGNIGAIIAVAINDFPMYLVINYGLKKENLSGLSQDLQTTLFLVLLIGLFITCRLNLGLGFPGYDAFMTKQI